MESRFCPEGYMLRGSQTPSSGFTDKPTDAPSIPLKAPLEVYSVYTQCAGAPFELPENIPVLLDAFGRLSCEQRHRFLRSCYWLQQATRTFVQSFSHSFLAAVSAVEALLDIRDYSLCESCGQKIFKGKSIRQSFADFLAGYIPLQTLTDRGHLHRPAFEERLKVLYDRRSMIAHGAGIVALDEGRWVLDTIGQQEESDLRTLLRILPLALQNWLVEVTKQ